MIICSLFYLSWDVDSQIWMWSTGLAAFRFVFDENQMLTCKYYDYTYFLQYFIPASMCIQWACWAHCSTVACACCTAFMFILWKSSCLNFKVLVVATSSMVMLNKRKTTRSTKLFSCIGIFLDILHDEINHKWNSQRF